MKNKEDLRVLKTKKNIVDSFIILLEKKSLDQISVTAVCNMAGCSRNTFYYHFPYKEALYDYVINSYVDRIKNSMYVIDSLATEDLDAFAWEYMYTAGKVVLSQKDALSPILVGEHANTFFTKLTDVLRESIMANTEKVFPDAAQNVQYRLMCWYSASAIVGFLKGCIYEVDLPTDKALNTLCSIHAPVFSTGVTLLQG